MRSALFHLERVSVFIYMVLQLRNPLGAIVLSADHASEILESLQKNLPADSSTRHELSECSSDLKVIVHCTLHMTRLIDDQLTLSKLDNNFLVITEVPARPNEFFKDALSLFRSVLTICAGYTRF